MRDENNNVGCVDVYGGKLWYYYNSTTGESKYFSRKIDAAQSIREEFAALPDIKKIMLAKLRAARGRAVNNLN